MKRKPELDVYFAIDMANLCEGLHCLPGPGGLMDQDWLHISMIRMVMQANQDKQEQDRQKQEAKARRPSLRRRR